MTCLVAVPYSQVKKRFSRSHELALGQYRWAVKNGPRRQVNTDRRKFSDLADQNIWYMYAYIGSWHCIIISHFFLGVDDLCLSSDSSMHHGMTQISFKSFQPNLVAFAQNTFESAVQNLNRSTKFANHVNIELNTNFESHNHKNTHEVNSKFRFTCNFRQFKIDTICTYGSWATITDW